MNAGLCNFTPFTLTIRAFDGGGCRGNWTSDLLITILWLYPWATAALTARMNYSVDTFLPDNRKLSKVQSVQGKADVVVHSLIWYFHSFKVTKLQDTSLWRTTTRCLRWVWTVLCFWGLSVGVCLSERLPASSSVYIYRFFYSLVSLLWNTAVKV